MRYTTWRRPIPQWLGRAWFSTWMVAFGLVYLVLPSIFILLSAWPERDLFEAYSKMVPVVGRVWAAVFLVRWGVHIGRGLALWCRGIRRHPDSSFE